MEGILRSFECIEPVKASTCDAQEMMHLGEEEVFSAAEVATAITVKR